MITIKKSADGLAFSVYVQPRSSKIAIIGCHQNALKIKLTAPPVSGAANKQCIQVLAKALGIPKSALLITGGQTQRMKQIRIQPINSKDTSSQLKELKNKLIGLSEK
jgi:uncharacterized protein (TIGR00251 family)